MGVAGGARVGRAGFRASVAAVGKEPLFLSAVGVGREHY